jgi:hypothetical protein
VRKSNADVMLCARTAGRRSAVRRIRTGGVTSILGSGLHGTPGSVAGHSNFYYDAMVLRARRPGPKVNQFIKSVNLGGTICPLRLRDRGDDLEGVIWTAQARTRLAGEGDRVQERVDARRATTYTKTCHVAVGRQMAMIEIQNGKPHYLAMQAEKVPPAPC